MSRYCVAFIGFCCFWLWGFISFVVYIHGLPFVNKPIADAAVVLTGRRGRIAEGNILVQKGLANKLFISGVHKCVRYTDLTSAEYATPEGIGYNARNTAQNADEIAQWQKQYCWRTIRLVTDAMHMPRSLLHVRTVCPDMLVIPHAIYPNVSCWVYVSEFHKFIYIFMSKLCGLAYSKQQYP